MNIMQSFNVSSSNTNVIWNRDKYLSETFPSLHQLWTSILAALFYLHWRCDLNNYKDKVAILNKSALFVRYSVKTLYACVWELPLLYSTCLVQLNSFNFQYSDSKPRWLLARLNNFVRLVFGLICRLHWIPLCITTKYFWRHSHNHPNNIKGKRL